MLTHEIMVQVLVIEEAAEVLEAHVLACLSEDVEQLILIGDHLQLRPKVETYAVSYRAQIQGGFCFALEGLTYLYIVTAANGSIKRWLQS